MTCTHHLWAFSGLLVAALWGHALAGEPAEPGKATYQRCAACHLPDGAGVPGAFPPLAANVTTFSASEQGRDYLTYVVLKGVSGELRVADQTYRGVMPAVGASLNDAQIADLLNFVVNNAVDKTQQKLLDETNPPTGQPALFTEEEIKQRRATIQAVHTKKTIMTLRNEAIQKAHTAASSPIEPSEGG
jgi:mono/diheme cytochrome c family protein